RGSPPMLRWGKADGRAAPLTASEKQGSGMEMSSIGAATRRGSRSCPRGRETLIGCASPRHASDGPIERLRATLQHHGIDPAGIDRLDALLRLDDDPANHAFVDQVVAGIGWLAVRDEAVHEALACLQTLPELDIGTLRHLGAGLHERIQQRLTQDL